MVHLGDGRKPRFRGGMRGPIFAKGRRLRGGDSLWIFRVDTDRDDSERGGSLRSRLGHPFPIRISVRFEGAVATGKSASTRMRMHGQPVSAWRRMIRPIDGCKSRSPRVPEPSRQ